MGYKKGYLLRTAFDSFTIKGKIGAGGCGEVYEVSDLENRPYAAKILDRKKASSSRLKRFKNEIHFCTKNSSKSIVRVHATGVTDSGETFYVMPLFSGTLRNVMAGGIAQDSVLKYFSQILDGVEVAHLKRVWHRDLKPENVLFSKSENVLVLADFGASHFQEEDLLTAVETKNGDRLANFLYSAPEQRERNQPVDGKSDIFALGLILNEMYTGRVPQGTGFRKVAEVAPNYAYLDNLIERMLQHDPAQRPSIAELKSDLIARGNVFISVQQLNTLNGEVVAETELIDPVVQNPIRILSFDYRNEHFTFDLTSAPPPNWIRAFQSPDTNFSYYHGAGPNTYGFQGNQAIVKIGPGMDPQVLVNHTKSYVDLANNQYRERAVREHHKRIREQREALAKRIADEEKRKKILAEVKI